MCWNHRGVYRWWFPEKEVLNILDDYTLYGERIQYRNIKGQYYVALYFGESGNLRTRFKNHINGPNSKSTLRRTLANHLAKLNTKDIDSLLLTCYLEWLYLNKKCVAQSIESSELATPFHFYPFNQTDHIFATKDTNDTTSVCCFPTTFPEVWFYQLVCVWANVGNSVSG